MKRLSLLLIFFLVSCSLITQTRTYFVITSHSISIEEHKGFSEGKYALTCDNVQRLITYVHRTGGPLNYGQINMTQFLNLFDIKTSLGEKSIPIKVTYIDTLTGKDHVFECTSKPPLYGAASKSLTWYISPITPDEQLPLGTFDAGTVLVTLMVDRDSYLFSKQLH